MGEREGETGKGRETERERESDPKQGHVTVACKRGFTRSVCTRRAAGWAEVCYSQPPSTRSADSRAGHPSEPSLVARNLGQRIS